MSTDTTHFTPPDSPAAFEPPEVDERGEEEAAAPEQGPADGDDPNSTAGPVGEPASAEAPPAWFQRKRERTSDSQAASPASPPRLHRRTKPKIVVEHDEEPDEHRTPWQRLVHWVRTFDAGGFGFSLFLHALVLILLGLKMISAAPGAGGAGMIWSFGDDETGFDDGPLDNAVAQEEGGQKKVKPLLETNPVTVAPSQQQAQPQQVIDENVFDTVGEGTGQGEGDVTGRAGGGGAGKSVPEGAITKGSFSVWVGPVFAKQDEQRRGNYDPAPGEPYFIYIVIRMPAERDKTYVPTADISGKVEGTDDYTTRIPYDKPNAENHFRPGKTYVSTGDDFLIVSRTRRRLPIHDDQVVLRVLVPPPDPNQRINGERVRDRITVRSRTLKEQQTLEIEF